MSKKTRRSVLRSVAIGATSTGMISPVAGKSKKRQNSSKGEVVKAAKRLFSKGKIEQARKLLEQSDVNHWSSTQVVDAKDDQISAQDRYVSPDDNSNTDISLDFYGTDGDYSASMSWTLNESGNWVSTNFVCPPDAAAIFWNENYWQPDGVGRDNLTGTWTTHEGTDGDTGSVEYQEYDSTGGILAKVDDPSPDVDDGQNATFRGGFTWDLHTVKSGATKYPVKAKYIHTWKSGRCLSGFDVAFNAGAITFSGGDPKQWSMATQTSP